MQPGDPKGPSQPAPALPTPALDPIEASLRPLRKQDFGYEQARHLLWRAGFGGTESQIRLLAEWGPEKAVDHLLNAEGVPADEPRADAFDKDVIRPPSDDERRELAQARRTNDNEAISRYQQMRQDREREDRRQLGEMQKWWLTRMIESPRPLEEKMTLFWHGLLAASFRGVENSYHMYVQNQTFRRHALGSYADLLHALIRDPAMLAFLNNNRSRRGAPNENLAREIMELFSLGVGNYTEQDIKEGARALTGFTFEDDDFRFQRNNHDTGVKRILGQSGPLDGDGFVRVILQQPACARYVTRRLYSFFVSDVEPDERGGDKELPPAQRQALAQFAQSFRDANYQVRPALRRLFLSEHFYEPRFLNQQIKSPVVLVVGAVRSLNCPARNLSTLNDALDRMGQRLFLPPSVKGWPGGRSWLNTSTLFVRQNTLAYLLTGRQPTGRAPAADPYDARSALDAGDDSGPIAAGDVRGTAQRVLRLTLGWAPASGVDALAAYAAATKKPLDHDTLTGMLLLATAMPEYQLC